MFEEILRQLPAPVLACRQLYDPATGGYWLPPRHLNRHFGYEDVTLLRAQNLPRQYDCVELPVADLLASLIVNTHSRLILETGTSRGFSTAHLAAAARVVHGDAARVITLDLDPAPAPLFETSPLAATIDARRTNSLEFEPAALVSGQRFDFMLLDSLHTYAHLSQEIERFLPWLATGGLLALHDTFYYDGLGLVAAFLAQVKGVEAIHLPTHRRHGSGLRSPGVSLFRKIAEVEPGLLRFPRDQPLPDGEAEEIAQPSSSANRFDSRLLSPHLRAALLPQIACRNRYSPALLAPQDGLNAEQAITAATLDSPGRDLRSHAYSNVLLRSGEAAARSDSALERRPFTVSQLRQKAALCHAQGQIDSAIVLLQRAHEQDPRDTEVVCDLATLALSSGDPVAAVRLARAACCLDPDHAPSLYTLGLALAQGGAISSAIRALRRVADGPLAAALRAHSPALADAVGPRLAQLEAVAH